MPVISVVMPVYNTEIPLLKDAVESILGQTFRDFEFLIVDDGAPEEVKEYLAGIADPRVRIIRNPGNIGITRSLNVGFGEAKGKYVARMDSDDISLPERFEKQLAFMEDNPDVIVCGALTVDYEKPSRKRPEKPGKMEDFESYKVRMLFSNPGPRHPTAFFNRELLDKYHIRYDEELRFAQDYGMYMTVSQFSRVCILPEVLLVRRHPATQVTQTRREEQIACDKMTQRKLLSRLLGDVTDEELDRHYHCSMVQYKEEKIDPQISGWYDRLIEANKVKKLYDRRKLKKQVLKIKKRLVKQTLTEDMTKGEKLKTVFRYLPFGTAFRFLAGRLKAKIKS